MLQNCDHGWYAGQLVVSQIFAVECARWLDFVAKCILSARWYSMSKKAQTQRIIIVLTKQNVRTRLTRNPAQDFFHRVFNILLSSYSFISFLFLFLNFSSLEFPRHQCEIYHTPAEFHNLWPFYGSFFMKS